MRPDLDEEVTRRVWERSVVPALEEFYFDDPDKRARFALDQVRAAIKVPAVQDVGASEPERDDEQSPGPEPTPSP
jgi:hypothetical protein